VKTDSGDKGNKRLSIELTSEQRARLDIYHELLLRWQRKINLVSNSTLPNLWERHFLDSLQLMALAGDWVNWVDIGSGGGFPGLVAAIVAPTSNCAVHLIEADKRKCAFMAEVSRETGAPVVVHADRIERVLPYLATINQFDIVSARGLASLNELIRLSAPVLHRGCLGLFLKGKEVAHELTNSPISSNFSVEFVPSATDPGAKIVVLRALKT
jgi:16S rRNA (guanine527-N7)-methyltransferase